MSTIGGPVGHKGEGGTDGKRVRESRESFGKVSSRPFGDPRRGRSFSGPSRVRPVPFDLGDGPLTCLSDQSKRLGKVFLPPTKRTLVAVQTQDTGDGRERAPSHYPAEKPKPNSSFSLPHKFPNSPAGSHPEESLPAQETRSTPGPLSWDWVTVPRHGLQGYPVPSPWL